MGNKTLSNHQASFVEPSELDAELLDILHDEHNVHENKGNNWGKSVSFELNTKTLHYTLLNKVKSSTFCLIPF